MHCFEKKHRLLKKSDYDHVFGDAKKLSNTGFIILYRENTLGYARLGLALSKKAVAKAHDRNRLKRLLRETFRKQELPAVDMVVLAKKNVEKMQNMQIVSILLASWSKLCQR